LVALNYRGFMSEAALAAEPQNRVVLRILPFALIIVCGYLPVGIPLATLPLEVHDKLGFGTLVVGIVVGVQSLVTLFTRPLAGILCDRAGAKVAVLTGAGISIAASAIYLVSTIPAFGASGALALLLTARVISGLAESLIMTGSLSWAIGTVGPQHTGKVMVWVGIGMYAAIAAGAPLGITLMKYQGAFGGFAAASMAMIVFSLLTVPAAAYVVPVAPQGGERLAFLRVVGRILPAGMGLALATLGFGAIGAFAALDFQNRGWPGAGFVLATFGVAYIATRLAFGGWPDRFGGARVAAWSLLVEACGLAMLWLAPMPAVAFAGAVLTGVGNALVFPSFGVEAVKRVPPASRGAALGAYVAFFDVGFGLGGPINGYFAGALGYPSVFAVSALGAAIAIVATRRARSRNLTQPTPA
jgi:predicted MFS family arabinose efflux permease